MGNRTSETQPFAKQVMLDVNDVFGMMDECWPKRFVVLRVLHHDTS